MLQFFLAATLTFSPLEKNHNGAGLVVYILHSHSLEPVN